MTSKNRTSGGNDDGSDHGDEQKKRKEDEQKRKEDEDGRKEEERVNNDRQRQQTSRQEWNHPSASDDGGSSCWVNKSFTSDESGLEKQPVSSVSSPTGPTGTTVTSPSTTVTSPSTTVTSPSTTVTSPSTTVTSPSTTGPGQKKRRTWSREEYFLENIVINNSTSNNNNNFINSALVSGGQYRNYQSFTQIPSGDFEFVSNPNSSHRRHFSDTHRSTPGGVFDPPASVYGSNSSLINPQVIHDTAGCVSSHPTGSSFSSHPTGSSFSLIVNNQTKSGGNSQTKSGGNSQTKNGETKSQQSVSVTGKGAGVSRSRHGSNIVRMTLSSSSTPVPGKPGRNQVDALEWNDFSAKFGKCDLGHEIDYSSRIALSAGKSVSKFNIFSFLINLFPIIKWIRNYDIKSDLLNDVITGFTIAVLHIPQGMAYGLLAGVGTHHGLYVSLFPVIIYALMGTSKHVSLGTSAMISIMIHNAIGPLSDASCLRNGSMVPCPESDRLPGDPPTTVEGATTICLLTGFIMLGMGFLHLGSLSLVLSDQIVSAFVCGSAFQVIN